jgi:hypothetical protein
MIDKLRHREGRKIGRYDLSTCEEIYELSRGVNALFSNTTGDSKTASGLNALFHNTTGSDNTASGLQALVSNTTGGNNTAIGFQALLTTLRAAPIPPSGPLPMCLLGESDQRYGYRLWSHRQCQQ